MFPKRGVKKLFGITGTLSDEDFYKYAGFIQGTIIGSEEEAKDWVTDVIPFNNRFKPVWSKLFELHEKEGVWGVFEDEWFYLYKNYICIDKMRYTTDNPYSNVNKD